MLLLKQLLDDIQCEMQRLQLWQTQPPAPAAFTSQQPFAIDTLTPHQWLQWIFIPHMRALLDARAPLPKNYALYPYFEEVLQAERVDQRRLLIYIKQLDELSRAVDLIES